MELVLKAKPGGDATHDHTVVLAEGLWYKNLKLSLFSLLPSLFSVIAIDFEQIMKLGFFTGYSRLVLWIIFLQAAGGLIVGATLMYSTNVSKGFAASASMVLSGVVAWGFLDFEPQNNFFIGALLVFGGIYIYSTR